MNNEIKIISPFKNFCMTIGALPTSYLESMSYYETLCWLCKYLENTINPAINQNAEALKELQEYVANYFDELNVQTEINNKLDEMATDGTLADIINEEIFTELNNKINTAETNITNLDTRIDETEDSIEDLEKIINKQKFTTCEEVAHRGAPEDTIENTITSFQYALNKGFKYFECDIQLTSDNNMVLFHNVTVDNTTNGTGTVNNLTYSYLRSLIYTNGGNISAYPNSHINDVSELIAFLKINDIKCFLELKQFWTESTVIELYNLIKVNGLLDKVIFTSFNSTYLDIIREIDKNVKISYLIEELTNEAINFCKTKNYIVAPSLTNLTRSLVQTAHYNNVSVYVWTINSIDNYETAVTCNADYICTNSRLYCYANTLKAIAKYNYSYPVYSQFDLLNLYKNNNMLPYAIGYGYPNGLTFSPDRAVCVKKIEVKNGDTLDFNLDVTKYAIAFPTFDRNDNQTADSGWISVGYYTINDTNAKWTFAYFKKLDNTSFKDYELDQIGLCANDIRITRASA